MIAFSELNPFTLSDFGLHACPPTLKVEDYSPPSKGWLPGGWLGLPGGASHPLDFTTLLGRSVIPRPKTSLYLTFVNNPG